MVCKFSSEKDICIYQRKPIGKKTQTPETMYKEVRIILICKNMYIYIYILRNSLLIIFPSCGPICILFKKEKPQKQK